MKLIDKAAIVAEIKKRIKAHKESLKNCDSSISEIVLKGSMSAYQSSLHFLDTLEVKEVDLEEEINRFWDSCAKHKNERGGNVIWSNKLEVEVLARHFFELGLKAAQKGE